MKTTIAQIVSPSFKNTIRRFGTAACLALLMSSETNAVTSPFPGYVGIADGAWTQVASACTIDESSLDYNLGGAGLSFPGSTTGEILARCNVTNVMAPEAIDDTFYHWNTLEVTYRDPDGNATDNQVLVTLYKVSTNGAAETLVPTFDPRTGRPTTLVDPSFITKFDSNSVTTATSSVQTRAVPFPHEFDFLNNAYYVLIKVKRANTTAGSTPAAFVVRLYVSFPIGG